MTTQKWQSNAKLAVLQARAKLLQQIRQFFDERQVLEVETPTLSRSAVPEPMIEPLSTQYHGIYADTFYLQTSPELPMKRLLASGSGSIYQMCTVFRDEEYGRLHNPEFRLLEWYRVGFDHHDLMDEMDALLQQVLVCQPATKITYIGLFQQYLQLHPLTEPLQNLRQQVQTALSINAQDFDRDTCLQCLLSEKIEKKLGQDAPLFVYDYPATQASLAQKSPNNPELAERFELYIQGIEIANGFHELTDASEQRQRFEQEQQQRKANQQQVMPLDEYFLQALEAGLPPCAGVALGIDRLLMLKLGFDQLQSVLSFSVEQV